MQGEAPRPPLLAGKVALVTGASSGLGEHFAGVLAGAGATVVAAARRLDRLEALVGLVRAGGGSAHAVAMDVTDPAGVRDAFARAEALAGRPADILVNNSGVTATKRLLDVEPEDFDPIIATNLRGAFFVAQAAARRMVEAGVAGRIVNVASAAGLRPLAQIGVYGVSKAAVVYMTKAMALEWGRFGIGVNALCPGYIETELNREHFASEGGRRLVAMLPRRRLGTPGDLDGLVLLLSSDAAGFVNGAVIAADDGLSVG